MKNLVIYYSLEGNTKLIAENIAKKIDADILELKTKKEYHKTGFKKYFWGGRSVLFHEKPELLSYNKNINDYENIFIGTPIWVGTYVPAYNTFLAENNISNKNIYFAGQITGVEGYVESISSGMVAALNASAKFWGRSKGFIF